MSVEELIVEDDEVKGLITQVGAIYRAKTVIITTGTFLRGEVIIGDLKYSSGPNNQMPSIKLADNIRELGFDMVRFKTGTPPRVNSERLTIAKLKSNQEMMNHGHSVMKRLNSSWINCHVGLHIHLQEHMKL